jgi:hypothetical protein
MSYKFFPIKKVVQGNVFRLYMASLLTASGRRRANSTYLVKTEASNPGITLRAFL